MSQIRIKLDVAWATDRRMDSQLESQYEDISNKRYWSKVSD